MKQQQVIEVDREVFHELLRVLSLIRLKGKRVRRKLKAGSDFIEIWPGVIIVLKSEKGK